MVGSLQDHDEVPFVEARKSDWLIEDVDGNTFADHVSAWGSTPLGATPPRSSGQWRRRSSGTGWRQGLRPERAAARARRTADRGRAARDHARRGRALGHARGGDRREAGARGDRASDDPDVLRPVPRRDDVPDGERVDRPLGGHHRERAIRRRPRVRAVPQRVPRAVPSRPRAVRRHALPGLPGGLGPRAPGRPRADRRCPDRARPRRRRHPVAVAGVLGPPRRCVAGGGGS